MLDESILLAESETTEEEAVVETPEETVEEPQAETETQEGEENALQTEQTETETETEAETPEEVKLPEKLAFDLKINGEEQKTEYTIDQVKEIIQKQTAAQKNFDDAAKMRQEVGQLVEQLKTNPMSVLSKVGVDVDKIAEDRILEKINLENMTEDQRQLHEAQKKLTDLEKYKQQQEETTRVAQEQQIIAAHRDMYQTSIMKAMTDNGMTTGTEAIDMANMKKIGARMLSAYHQGVPVANQNINEHALKVMEQNNIELKSSLSKLTPEQLAEYLGDENFKKIRQADITKLKQPLAKENNGNPNAKMSKKKKKGKGLTNAEWRDFLDNIED